MRAKPAVVGVASSFQSSIKRLTQGLIERLKHRSQGFAVFTLLTGVAVQIVLALAAGTESIAVRPTTAAEVRIAAMLGAGISVATFLVDRRRALWALFALRIFVIAVLFDALRSASALVLFMVVVPPLVESVTYERIWLAVLANSAVTAAFAVVLLTRNATIDHIDTLTLLGAPFVTALYLFTQHYREKLVRSAQRIANLERAFEQLTDSNLGLQLYASNAETESASRERTRITRELHDSVGYALTNIVMMMKAAGVLINRDLKKLDAMIGETRATAEEALREARRILHRLRSVDGQPYQGIGAISRLVKAYRLATDVKVEVHYGNLEWSFGREIDRAFYRLVQEGLTNAYRHGGATWVRITMWMDEHEVMMRIWDNGRGAQVVNEGIGLAGMRERMQEMGGTLTAANAPDGFQVTARIPWRTVQEA